MSPSWLAGAGQTFLCSPLQHLFLSLLGERNGSASAALIYFAFPLFHSSSSFLISHFRNSQSRGGGGFWGTSRGLRRVFGVISAGTTGVNTLAKSDLGPRWRLRPSRRHAATAGGAGCFTPLPSGAGPAPRPRALFHCSSVSGSYVNQDCVSAGLNISPMWKRRQHLHQGD